MTQSPKLPDLNVPDLSFFRALQSKQWSNKYAKTIDELLDSVMLAFHEFDAMTLNFGSITLMTWCFDNVITCHGDYDYISNISERRRGFVTAHFQTFSFQVMSLWRCLT